MNQIGFNQREVSDLLVVQPGLYVVDPVEIAGTFSLNAIYNGTHLEREFQIEALADAAAFGLPAIKEVGGESDRILTKYSLQKRGDLHINADGTICIGVPSEVARRLPGGRPLKDLFEFYVTPYFYGLAFFDAFGRWPWSTRSHGLLGVMEYYSESEVELNRSDWTFAESMLLTSQDRGQLLLALDGDGSQECPCKSGRAVKDCHDALRTGFARLTTYIGIEQSDLLRAAMKVED